MIFKYIRFSTGKQDERQQENTIDQYLAARGMKADDTYKDEGISGGVDYSERELGRLCERLQKGDTLIVSEISRITRSGIGELSEIIETYFKPNGLRLIVCNVGFEIDCSNLNPMVEMQLMMLATFAKIEKQLIIERTKSALDARKKTIAEHGSFISKAGNFCDHLGNLKGCDMSAAQAAAADLKKEEASEWRRQSFAYWWVQDKARQGWTAKAIAAEVERMAEKMPDKFCNRQGGPLRLSVIYKWIREANLGMMPVGC